MNTAANKMKVEIWSDVMCPFCYIGKRKFEKAVAQFADSSNIEVIWKSFQLSPDMVTDTTISTYQYLADHKGIPVADAKRMSDQVTQSAAREGLVYNFDNAVVANSFKAHRFTHYAKSYGKQDAAEEALFKAYFTEGKNIDDNSILVSLGVSIGLDAEDLNNTLQTDKHAAEVDADITEANMLGIRGVPFFVFDRKYAVSGAQDSSVFIQTLSQSVAEWRTQQSDSAIAVTDGAVCTPDGVCE